MKDKIGAAVRYVNEYIGASDMKEVKNDAANFFADNYEEYCAIWDALDII